MIDVPLLIEFAPETSLYRERDLQSHLPIVQNGPAGTFVVFPSGERVSLPTDQIVFADDKDGAEPRSETGDTPGVLDSRGRSSRVAVMNLCNCLAGQFRSAATLGLP